MDDIINTTVFLTYLNCFLNLATVIAKENNNPCYNMCLETSNKFKEIEIKKDITSSEIRKFIKRINLSLKEDVNGNPVNISDKNNQKIILLLKPFEAIESNDFDIFISQIPNINILPGISVDIIVKSNSELLWLYLRCLFYMTQYLLACNNKDVNSVILDKSCDQLIEIMDNIEKKNNTSSGSGIFGSLDNFLKDKLMENKIDKQTLIESKEQMMKMINQGNNVKNRTFDLIFEKLGDKIENFDISGGNFFQSISAIANNIVDEIKEDLDKDPESFEKDILGFENIIHKAKDGENNTAINSLMGSLSGIFENIKNTGEINVDDISKNIISQFDEVCNVPGVKDEIMNVLNTGKIN